MVRVLQAISLMDKWQSKKSCFFNNRSRAAHKAIQRRPRWDILWWL